MPSEPPVHTSGSSARRVAVTQRALLIGVLALGLVTFALQLLVVRPYAAPAGAGLSLSGVEVLAGLGTVEGVTLLRPPDIAAAAGLPVVVDAVEPLGPAARAGLVEGLRVGGAGRAEGPRIDIGKGLPRDSSELLSIWRRMYWIGWRGEITLDVEQATGNRQQVTVAREPVWRTTADTRAEWMRRHAGALLRMAAFIGGALALVALGTRGATAALMTLALVGAGVANGGPLWGAERGLGRVGSLLLLFVWVATPLVFPIVGLAVLHFPRRADALSRHRWVPAALVALALPMVAANSVAALYLLGADLLGPLLGWLSTARWTFDASFALALAANVAIAIEGLARYKSNPDATERRRILIVVATGVPAVLAYAVLAGVPLAASWLARPITLPWAVAAALDVLVLLPAVGLPYAVLVRRVFSPRTVLRQSLQYALARRTLSALVTVPVALLALALVEQRDRALVDIILGRPLFYLASLALIGVSLRYRDRAQRWLDRRFFRAEYDAREIMVSLASRVPYESDPRELVGLVMSQIERALHPETIAVLAGEGGALDVIASAGAESRPLPATSALVTMLQWSDEPLDLGVGDERSAAGRLPDTDRAWVTQSGSSLLVPILTGTGDQRMLIGAIALGAKRSEEPYTAEDMRLLRNIAAQMSVALDLSRLRRRAGLPTTPTPATAPDLAPARTSTGPGASATAIGICPACQRAVAWADGRCPEHQAPLEPMVGLPAVIDNKYRVDALVGRGGMGAVFRARDLGLDRDVAIKVLRAELTASADARARFQREAQIVARLQHPSIVTVFDYGTLPDRAAFLVMELVRGEDLRRLLKREHRLSPARGVALMSGAAAGVAAAHAAGVLHRDLKPENVLLPESGADPKVLDFGVAKMTDAMADPGATRTLIGTIVGTPAYMAPEQLRGGAIDARADVFSLGVMTYETLTGRLPFGVGSFMDIAMRHHAGASAVPTDDLPPHLAAPIVSAMALDPEARPATPTAFVEALRLGLR